MANYESNSQDLADDINSSDDLGPVIKDAIDEVVNDNADANGNVEVVVVESADDIANIGDTTTVVEVDASLITPENAASFANLPLLIITGSVGAVLQGLLAPAAGSSSVVVGGEGDDFFSYVGNTPAAAASGLGRDGLLQAADAHLDGTVNIDLAGGDDSVETAGGNDSITGGAGNDSVSSGAGSDSILAGVGNDSIDGGEGFDQVAMNNLGGADNYTFEVIEGEVVVTDVSTGEVTTTANAEYIALGDGEAIINAKDTEDGTAARQSEAILGRQMTAEELEDYQQLVDEIGLDAASGQLMEESGFADDTSSLTDLEYINLLYNQTFGRDVDPEGQDFYLQQLSEGIIDRAKLAADLSWSDEGIDSNDLVNEIDGLV